MVNKYFISQLYLILRIRNSHPVIYLAIPTPCVQGFSFTGRFASVGLNKETDFQLAIWRDEK